MPNAPFQRIILRAVVDRQIDADFGNFHITHYAVSDNIEPLIVPTDAISSMDSDEAAARVEAGVHLRDVDAVGFHDAEVSADVEAPSVTSDSLGVGLASIMARRGN